MGGGAREGFPEMTPSPVGTHQVKSGRKAFKTVGKGVFCRMVRICGAE